MNKDFAAAVFDDLKVLLNKYSEHLVCVKDEPGDYYLDTGHIQKNKKPMFFGAVKIGKTYVSFHLMPVYCFPNLLGDISHELKNRMQGKSCFNFKTTDDALIKELAGLVDRGYQAFEAAGYVSPRQP